MSGALEELTKLRSGGAYIPPAKLRQLLGDVSLSKQSQEYQKLQWEQLKKSINGLINKVNKSNIKQVVIDLFKINIVRGQGPLVRSIMKSQSVSLPYTQVYSALICVINSKIPEIGELLITRLILQFRRSYKRNDKELCKATVIFMGQLVNFQVCHEILVLQLLHLLLEKPTSDSVEIACSLMSVTGPFLLENSSTACTAIFSRLRIFLNEDIISKRVQYIVEDLFKLRRSDFEGIPVIPNDLDLVDDDDKITHTFNIDDKLKAQEMLNIFRYDAGYEDREKEYDALRNEILGNDSEGESGSEFEDDNEEEDSDSNSDNDDQNDDQVKQQIKDLTEAELTNFQKTVYLTIMSSLGHEEAVHKLLKLQPIDPDRKEYMLVDMIIKCCAQEKTYAKYYGLIGESLIVASKEWETAFSAVFKENYEICHRFETNLLRNIASFWGHMFASDKMGWEPMSVIMLTEENSTSSGRIFLKFMFSKLLEEIGINKLRIRVKEDYIKPYISGMFPEKGSNHLRFCINFFTAIGLGILTEEMREILSEIPEDEEEDLEEISPSDSEQNEPIRGRSRGRNDSGSRTPSRSYSRSPSYSRSRSRSYSMSRTESRSPSQSRSRSYSRSRSRSHSRSSSRISRGGTVSKNKSNRAPLRSRSYSRSPSRSPSGSPGSCSSSRSRSYSRSRSRSYSRSESASPPNKEPATNANNTKIKESDPFPKTLELPTGPKRGRSPSSFHPTADKRITKLPTGPKRR